MASTTKRFFNGGRRWTSEFDEELRRRVAARQTIGRSRQWARLPRHR